MPESVADVVVRLPKTLPAEARLAAARIALDDDHVHMVLLTSGGRLVGTIVRYSGHDNGAVYGAPEKQLDGRTHLDNLFICGTDQGFVGIIGSITSGIAMANRHCLQPK